jgi:DNA-binding NtrC family response regulator
MLAESPRLDASDLAAVLPEAVVSVKALPGVMRLAEAVEAAERAALTHALQATGGNRQAAARLLGISRATLYEKLAYLGFETRSHAAAPATRTAVPL